MNQDIENIIKKNLPKERHHIDFDFNNVHSCPCGGTTTGCRLCLAEMCDNPNCKLGKGKDFTDEEIKSFNQALSQIDTKLIADEVLKVVAEKIFLELKMAIIGCSWCDLEDGRGKFVNEKQLSCNIIRLLSNLSTNKENKNNE